MTQNSEDSRRLLKAIIKSLAGKMCETQFDASLADIGLDSLKTMDLVLTIEEKFSLQIPDEELTGDNLKTPNTILRLIERLKR